MFYAISILYISLLAQSNPSDILAGSTGWIGAGLLGAVLAWLMFVHLPSKDKQIEKMLETRDLLVLTLNKEHNGFARERQDSWVKMDQERRGDYKESLKMILEHCQKETDTITVSTTKALDEISKAVVDLREVIEEGRMPSGGSKVS